MTHELSNMPWWEAEEKFRESKLVIVPVGATEQHGLHLGLGADWIQAWTFANKIGAKTGKVVLPVLPYGVSGHHKEFPGVMTLTENTYENVIFELLTCLARNGVTHVVFVNGHGGNTPALITASKLARDKYGMLCSICDWWTAWEHRKIFGQKFEAHGGYAETSFMLASRPEAVKMEYAVLSSTKQHDQDIKIIRAGKGIFKDGYVLIPLKTVDVSDTGSMTEASPDEELGTRDYSMITLEFAEKLMDEYVEWLAEFVRVFEGFKVSDVYVSKEKAMKELV
jgi:creatinine amidohydrolase